MTGSRSGDPIVIGSNWIMSVAPAISSSHSSRNRLTRSPSIVVAIAEPAYVARTAAVRAAIVSDDLASTDPWHPRGIEIRGRAEAIALPTPLIRIHPERIVSWGLGAARSARTVAG